MKRTYLLYGLVILAVSALVVGAIGSAMGRFSARKPAQQPAVISTTPSETSTESEASTEIVEKKKKACGCCAERMARLQEQIRKARERKAASRQAEATSSE